MEFWTSENQKDKILKWENMTKKDLIKSLLEYDKKLFYAEEKIANRDERIGRQSNDIFRANHNGRSRDDIYYKD